MGFWDRVGGLFRGEKRAAAPLDGIGPASIVGLGPPRRGTRELLVAYREQPWLRAVTGRIARGVASATWSVYARAETPLTTGRMTTVQRLSTTRLVKDVGPVPSWRWNVDRVVRDLKLTSHDHETRVRQRRELAGAGLLREIPDHPVLEMLHSPNPDQTGLTALKLTQTWLDIVGEAFWLLKVVDGKPAGYVPIPPHWVTQVPTSSKPTFRISFSTIQMEVAKTEMVWLRDPNPENPFARGTGIAESLGDELETDEYASKYIKAWFYNGAMASAIASFEGATENELKRAREKWDQEHRGAANAHRIFFSNGKMNFARIDSSFREQQLPDLRRLSRDTLGQVFGVPPEMIGIIENSNRSTIDAARFIYALGIEFPRCQFLRSEVQHQLATRFDGEICIECEVPIPEDEAHRLAVMTAQPRAFDLNEWRGEAGYDPLPDFDGVFPAPMPGQVPGTPAPSSGTPDDGEDKPDEPSDDDIDEPNDGQDDASRADPPWVRGSIA